MGESSRVTATSEQGPAAVLGRSLATRLRNGIERAVMDPLARLVGTLVGVDVDEPVAAFTFDDGPHPHATPRLLDILSEHDVRATFFCVGMFAAENPDIIRRMAEEGHVVANHTWDHPSMPRVSAAERRRQLRRCSEVLQPYEAPFFRPPYGDQSLASQLATLWAGYDVVGWDVDGQDWLDRPGPQIADRIRRSLRPGSIILLHDRIVSAPDPDYLDRRPMLEAVRLVLEDLTDEYEFVTVPRLLDESRPRRVHWYRRADVEWLNSLRAPDGEAWRYPV